MHPLRPVDIASLCVFRASFGLLMAGWCLDYLLSGRIPAIFAEPKFHFTYYAFDFVRPLAGAGMTILFCILLLLALCVAAGLQYRLSALLFASGFTYVFLIDRTLFQNHYYLVALISWTLAACPLNRLWAIDAIEGPRSDFTAAWNLWLVRFHVGLPYFFGGVAKLNGDWLAGEPMRTHLLAGAWPEWLRPALTSAATIQVLTWGGLLFDLSIVPLLLWRPTRAAAYVLCVGFHLCNAFLFDIHVFPWFMIVATTIFFEPGWPRRFLRLDTLPSLPAPALPTTAKRIAICALLVYCGVQSILPFRAFFAAGDSAWTERAHQFSWRMMLRSKTSAIRYYIVDRQTGHVAVPDIYRFVTVDQSERFSRDPEMILHFAHFLAEQYRTATGRDGAVHALVLTSLNGRKPQLLIDPNVDLAAEPRGFVRRDWIVPLTEPLRAEPWRLPLGQWESSVDLPTLTFLPKRPVSGRLISSSQAAFQPVAALPSMRSNPSPQED